MKRIAVAASITALAVAFATPALADDQSHANGRHSAEQEAADAEFDAAPTAGPTATYIVQLSPTADRGAEVAKVKGRGAKVEHEYAHAINGIAVELTAEQAAAMALDPDVTRVERDLVASIADTQSPAVWGLDRVDQQSLPLSGAYSYRTQGAGVTAYVIDTGILASHSEFGGRVVSGYDAITAGGTATDCHGHGTHVAGTIGGGTYGLAKAVTLVPVRVLDCAGSGTTAAILAGIDWVITNHTAGTPAVANLSLGYQGIVSTVDAAVGNLVADGVTAAVAAGNSNANACNYTPAASPTAITVGATGGRNADGSLNTNALDTRADYSNYGTCLDIFAPGSGVTSAGIASTTATATMSGTSMATPHVAGAAALYLAGNPTASPATVTAALTGAATPGVVVSPGTGSVNRLLYVDGGAPVTPPAVPTVSTLSPTSGPVGSTVTITGTNLLGASAVAFGGTSATFTVTSATAISAKVPAGASTGAVTVTTAGGTATGPNFSVTVVTAPAAPVITSAASNSSGRATVRWTLGSNGGSALTGLTLRAYRVIGGVTQATASNTWNLSTASTSTTVSLTRAATYKFTVTATNAAGSTASAQSAAVTIR